MSRRASEPWCIPHLVVPNITVFVAGACVMVTELVAGRLISRYLGQSLYTWTSIIGVVLAGISLGSYIGGRLADHHPPTKLLSFLFLAGSLACLSIPMVNSWIGGWCLLWKLNWPGRIFLHVTLVFLGPSTLLGAICPVAAKSALNRGNAVGRTVGNIYAWGAAGSIAGTVLAGFWLMAIMGAVAVIRTTACILAVMGILYSLRVLAVSESGSAAKNGVLERRPVMSDPTTEERVSSRGWMALFPLFMTILLTGVCTMALEVTAGRMVSRYLGQSLYTWTSVIGVMLAGMSLGNSVGGRLADRFKTKKTLSLLFVLSSASCLSVPLINQCMGAGDILLSMRLSRSTQIIIHVTSAFIMPSMILGMIPPIAAKMALSRGYATGCIIGGVYAWGSVGGIIGAVLAGFFMIPAMGAVATICVIAIVLALAGVAYAHRLWISYVGAAACIVAATSAAAPGVPARTLGQLLGLREAHDPEVFYRDESEYSYITVKADPKRPHLRELYLDRFIHSKVDITNPLALQYSYSWLYSSVIDNCFAPGEPLTTLTMGGGGYTFPRYLELTRPGSHIEVAEIDPAVTRAAHAAFGFPETSSVMVHHRDAGNHVAGLIRRKRAGETMKTFDCIFGDVVNDDVVPYHIVTQEFNQKVKELLNENGIYFLTVIDILEQGRFLGSVINTCRQTFPHVYVFNMHSRKRYASDDTFIVVSSKRELDLTGIEPQIRAGHAFTGGMLTQSQLTSLVQLSGGMVLTDDFAPVENLLAEGARSYHNHEESLLAHAGRLTQEGRIDDAIKVYRKILRTRPTWAQAHENLGVALLKSGNRKGAISEWRTAIAIDRASWDAHYNIGAILEKQGDLDGAISEWRQTITINPNFDLARYRLGRALAEKGDLDGAISEWRQTVTINPNFYQAYRNIGLALAEKGDLKNAIDELRKAIAINPEFAAAHENLAVILWMLKDYNGAWTHVKRCYEYGGRPSPNFITALRRDSGRVNPETSKRYRDMP